MATLFQSLRRFFGNVGSTGQQQGIQYGEPFARIYTKNTDLGIDGALQVSAVWACVELLADNISTLPLFVYRRATDGHKEPARETSLWKLLHENPNRRHTPSEFWNYMVVNYLLRGNAYAKIVRDGAQEPIGLIPLSADQVEIELLKDGSLVYKYQFEGTIEVLAESSVFHWRDKGNGLIGMSRLDYMRSSIGLAAAAQDHAELGFRKGGKRPGTFLIDKALTPQQREQIRANFKSLVEGSSDDLLVLEAGAKFEPLGLTPNDLQLLDTRRFSVEDIARWFGLPSVLINDTSQSTVWGSGIESIIESTYKFRLRPILEGLEQAIERRVFTPRQRELYTAEFSLEAILRGNAKQRMEMGVQAVTNGLMTRNEWRQLENWPRIDGGDDLTAQINLAPIDKLGERPEVAPVVEPVTEERLQRLVQEVKSAPVPVAQPKVEVKAGDVHITMPEIKAGDVYLPAPVVHVAAPEVTYTAPEVKVDVAAPVVNVAAPEVSVEAVLPPPEVNVNLPARKTESTVERDSTGRITKTTQIETDL